MQKRWAFCLFGVFFLLIKTKMAKLIIWGSWPSLPPHHGGPARLHYFQRIKKSNFNPKAIHCEKLGSILQQGRQHQSVRELFYAEPQLGPVLPLWIFSTSQPFLTISSHFKAIQGYSRLFQAIPGYHKLFHPIPVHFNLCQSIWTNYILLIAGCGSASLKLCV